MPDPRTLSVGDWVRFTNLPEEWRAEGFTANADSVDLMRCLVARRRPSRIARVTDDGYPWIDVRIRTSDGRVEYHSWGIYASTGWTCSRRRSSR
jgi:hypothetical protein